MVFDNDTGKADLLIADIGSTITKVCAIHGMDTDAPRFLGRGMALTTVDLGDVAVGLDHAARDLEHRFGVDISEAEWMAASSAAGGLRMTVHGLTRDMTLRAAREASLGAGAIVTFTTAGRLHEDDLDDIENSRPNIILLAGGVDYGDRDTVVHNAGMLASRIRNVSVIYAGNITARKKISRILESAGIRVKTVDNVYPRIDELNMVPVRTVIQDLFSTHIITAPGMENIEARIMGDIMPTPGAVMKSTELLHGIIGDLVTVDVGGATTDVHSVTEGSQKLSKMMVAPEPKSKRTVEGDLGVFINAGHIVEASEGALSMDGKIEPVPRTNDGVKRSSDLARWAVNIAIWRHAGEIRAAYGAYGRNEIVEGRDLTAVTTIIGTGGALTRLGTGREILENLKQDPRGRKLLPPPETPVLLDRHYIMAAAGVLAGKDARAAEKLLMTSLK